MKVQFEDMSKRIKNIQTQMNRMISSLSKNVNEYKQKIIENNVWIKKKRSDIFASIPKSNITKKVTKNSIKKFTFELLKHSTYYIKSKNLEGNVKVERKKFL